MPASKIKLKFQVEISNLKLQETVSNEAKIKEN